MTTVESATKATEFFQSRLSELRGKLRRWITIAGLGRWMWLVLAVFAADMILDRIFRMDFAQRSIVLILMLGIFVWLLYRKLFKPLTKKISDNGLMLEVEKHFSELDQSLISSFQFAQQSDFETRGVSPRLAAVTIQTGMDRAQHIDFGGTLDQKTNRTNLLILLSSLGITLLLAVGVTQSSFLKTWFRRNLLLANDQWPQSTYLEIVGAVDGKIIVPRGIDYRQLVRVTEQSSVKNVDVTLETESAGTKTFQKMKPTGKDGGREHAFVFHSISSQQRIRAAAGDGTTDWVDIELVEPPAILEMRLTALLPSYTGQAELELAGSGPHRVLNGSGLRVMVTSNKPLSQCKLNLDEESFALQPLDETRNNFQVIIGTAVGSEAVAGVQGGKYVFQLMDESQLQNIRDFSFTIKLGEDRLPVVRAKLLGISGLVVPRALVPVSYGVEDDFGLTKLGFECNWSGDDNQAGSALNFPVKVWNRTPPQAEEQDVAVLAIEKLKLTPGTSLRFLLVADDNLEPNAGQGRSREFLVRVVTDEELRADLLRREIEQRKSFQQTYDAQMDLTSELRQVATIPTGSLSNEQILEQRQNKLVSLYRMQRGIGTSANLVAQRFEEFLVEAQNNRLDEETMKIDPTRTIESRFNNEIIVPIRKMDEEMVSAAARNIDNCRRNLDNEANFQQSIETTTAIQEQILERMRQIMASMESSESFQETVNRLLEIKRIEEGLRKQLDGQGNTKGIFDDK